MVLSLATSSHAYAARRLTNGASRLTGGVDAMHGEVVLGQIDTDGDSTRAKRWAP